MKQPKILTFEGAGWEGAEHNGVGNCRIRTTFRNENGSEIYLEIIGHKPHAHSPNYVKQYTFCGIVDFIFYTSDRKTNYSQRFAKLNKMTFEYTKKSILAIVNSLEVGGKFDDIEVRNDGWNGFDINGVTKEEFNKNTQNAQLSVAVKRKD